MTRLIITVDTREPTGHDPVLCAVADALDDHGIRHTRLQVQTAPADLPAPAPGTHESDRGYRWRQLRGFLGYETDLNADGHRAGGWREFTKAREWSQHNASRIYRWHPHEAAIDAELRRVDL